MTTNLFDTRGGTFLDTVCEVCNDPIPSDSILPVCSDCAAGESDE